MDYKATLNLPKTAFPMKANLQEREPTMLAWWEQFGIYKRLRHVAADRPLWILHDGPPYANGNIHLGHVLNKVLKDVIVKSRAMLGFNAVYLPGWDCHGLPIEHQVDKELGLDDPAVDIRRAMDPVEKRKKCREYALRYIDIQRNEFKRLGVFGDWDNPYVTMAPAYQAIIAREFGRFVGRGLVHKGLKPVHWCMHCKTALAQAEVEYEEQRTPSVWVKFPLTSVPAELQAKLVGRRESLGWTRVRASSTSHPATARRTTSSADHSDSRSSTRWTTTAASSRGWSASPASPSGRRIPRSSTISDRSGCSSPSARSTTRTHTAGVARTRRSSARPSSGSSSSTNRSS